MKGFICYILGIIFLIFLLIKSIGLIEGLDDSKKIIIVVVILFFTTLNGLVINWFEKCFIDDKDL